MINSNLQLKLKTIEVFKTSKEMKRSYLFNKHVLIYVHRGKATFSYGYRNTGKNTEKMLIFIPAQSHLHVTIEKDTELLVFTIKDEIRLCDCNYRKNDLKKIDNKQFNVLKAKKEMLIYFECLKSCLAAGFDDEEYLLLKIKELLILVKILYTASEILAFFEDAHVKDTHFSERIWNSYRQYDSVKEFAKAMNYSVSGFEKKFKKTFGVSPYKWMKEQKVKLIYQEVCFGKYNFKQIADKYNFSSPSTFSDFYKMNFGETPGVSRKKAEKRGLYRNSRQQ